MTFSKKQITKAGEILKDKQNKNDEEILNMILDNGDLKKRYSKILDELEIEFRRQLKYYVGPTKL